MRSPFSWRFRLCALGEPFREEAAWRRERLGLGVSAGGLRKLRWAGQGRGKRGGLRVIYYWAAREQTFYMLYVYAKNDQGDLTPAQVKTLRRIVREEFR